MTTRVEMLDQYLREVGGSLPSADRQDILDELESNLVAELEETTPAWPPSDDVVAGVLRRYGDPRVVAAKYRTEPRTLSFGHRLIGPELWPTYLRLLRINLGVTIAIFVAIVVRALVGGRSAVEVGRRTLGLPGIGVPLLLQLVLVTLVFVLWDRLDAPRRRRWTPAPAIPAPPSPRQLEIGIALFGLATAWWMAVPNAPALLLGPAARVAALSDRWPRFHLLVAGVLGLGVISRLAVRVRPRWASALPALRLLTDALGLLALATISASYPLFVAADASAATEHTRLLRSLNAPALLWWFWPFLAINALANAAACARRLRRAHRGPAPDAGA